MQKRRTAVIVIVISMLICVIMTGCGKKYYWEYNCVWHCEKPYCIDIPSYGTVGNANIKGKEIELYIENDDRDEEIAIYDYSDIKNPKLLWICRTEVIDDCLCLTILEDYVSNQEGKTIKMKQTHM